MTLKEYKNMLRDVLEEMHPSNWELVNIPAAALGHVDSGELPNIGLHNLKVSNTIRSKGFGVLIRHPEIFIKNSKGFTHLKKDLITLTVFDQYIPLRLFGTSLSCSPNEFSTGYIHSHCALHFDSESYKKFGSFCTGGVGIAGYLNKDSAFDAISFKHYLLTLEDFLSWESLEGGPHKKMYLVDYKLSNINNIPFKNIISDESKRLLPQKTDMFINEDTKLISINIDFDKELIDSFIDLKNIISDVLYSEKNLPLNPELLDDVEITIGKLHLKREIYPNVYSMPQTNEPINLPIQVRKHLLNEYEKNINKILLWLSKTSNSTLPQL